MTAQATAEKKIRGTNTLKEQRIKVKGIHKKINTQNLVE